MYFTGAFARPDLRVDMAFCDMRVLLDSGMKGCVEVIWGSYIYGRAIYCEDKAGFTSRIRLTLKGKLGCLSKGHVRHYADQAAERVSNVLQNYTD